MTGSDNTISPPTQPTEDSQPTAAVSKPQTIREFETALRDLGYSRAEAKSIANNGFKGFNADDSESEQLDQLTGALRNLTQTFKR